MTHKTHVQSIRRQWYLQHNQILTAPAQLSTFTAILAAQFKFILKNKHIYVFLLILGISSHSRDFHSHRDVTITGEGLRILTCARHLWPLSSEGFLACNTYKLQHGVSVISGHIHVLPSVWQVELSLPVLTT